MTNNPTKYESNPASGYRGVAVTRILTENSLSPITPTKIIKSTWRHSMHIYTSWPTILLNMKAIRRAVTEEKPWQEQDWRNSLSPITPTKIIKSTWRHSMHIYTSWPTILLNMKAIRQAVTEEKPWQEQDWRPDRQTDGRVKNIIPLATSLHGV